MKHYSDIAIEQPYKKDANAKLDDPARKLSEAPSNWPSRGAIEFHRVCARYRKELGLVLDDVSFSVKSGQKVGVCGRTGSGKSSLMLTLFRVLELDGGCEAIRRVVPAGFTCPAEGSRVSPVYRQRLREGLALFCWPGFILHPRHPWRGGLSARPSDPG